MNLSLIAEEIFAIFRDRYEYKLKEGKSSITANEIMGIVAKNIDSREIVEIASGSTVILRSSVPIKEDIRALLGEEMGKLGLKTVVLGPSMELVAIKE